MSEVAGEIQRRMEAVRCHLIDDADHVADSARQMVDWREYVRRYPWISVGVAAAVGYLAVPRRVEIISPDIDTLLDLAKKNKLVVEANPPPRKREGLLDMLLTIAGNAAVRGAISYLGQQTARQTAERAPRSDAPQTDRP